MPEPPLEPTQVPRIEKHPAVRSRPPVPYIEDVALLKLAKPSIAKRDPGEDVAIPTRPLLVTINIVDVAAPVVVAPWILRRGMFDAVDVASIENRA